MPKPRDNRIKATFWTEGGLKSEIDVGKMHKDHHLTIYKLLLGTFTAGQTAKIAAAIEGKE